jgi:hypothetical protein
MTLNIEDPAALHVSTVTVLGTELPAGGEEGPHGGPGTPRRALPWPGCLCTARAAAGQRPAAVDAAEFAEVRAIANAQRRPLAVTSIVKLGAAFGTGPTRLDRCLVSSMPWWDSYIKPVQKEENKFASVGYQRQLAAELHRVEPNSEVGHEQMAETLRTVAEMMVWGDKNDRTVLDYFLEQNIVGHFVSLLAQRPNKHVTCQVVNHLSMLLQSLNSPEAVFFLLSNNHINLLINHNFDFTDEEVASYYVSFLKSISLRLNVSTVQLFFNASTKEFPLFVEATKFFDHPESMVPALLGPAARKCEPHQPAPVCAFETLRTLCLAAR